MGLLNIAAERDETEKSFCAVLVQCVRFGKNSSGVPLIILRLAGCFTALSVEIDGIGVVKGARPKFSWPRKICLTPRLVALHCEGTVEMLERGALECSA